MYLISQDDFFSWDDLSVDKAAKEKKYSFNCVKSGLVLPTKAVLSLKWDIDAGSGNFQVLSVIGTVSDPTNTVALTLIDYSDGLEKTLPHTVQAGIGTGGKTYLITPTDTSNFGKLLFDQIKITMSPASDQNAGWIRGRIALLSE